MNLILLSPLLLSVANGALVSAPGEAATVPSWKVQSSVITGNDASKLSVPGLDVTGWYTIGSKATLMSTLIENKFYNDTNLFYSTNLDAIDDSQFRVPWFYRAQFELNKKDSYYQLVTHGISSRADMFLNGALVADKNRQAGAYAGLEYDITEKAKSGQNVLLIRVYPTDYNRDFALGFVDWNPYPPDNGTGIWRDLEIKETGKLTFAGGPRVTTKLNGKISIKVDVANSASESAQGDVACSVQDPSGKEITSLRKAISLAQKASQKVSFDFDIRNPHVWWPKQWGAQPLYSAACQASIGSRLSDSSAKIRFGIRTVTSSLNRYNDTTFFVNEKPFQVLGAGYTSDIFLRFDEATVRTQLQYVLDMGHNTVRLEGKQEHPRLYELADEMGIMIMAGWECCDKWEGWSFNDEGSGEKWKDEDYSIANISMRHEAEMMQHHPSLLAFLVGSDFWPDDRATRIYIDALKAFDWEVPIIASASQRGYPNLLGDGGMKMEGPYDWVPPNYWYADRLGAAFGFGSELGAGVGTPEINSLKRFLSPSDQEDLWKSPNKGLYHMSTSVSSFYTREIYNKALWARYGAPTSLANYLLKAQMMDYEATRAEFEAYAAKWTADRPATGLIYWMLNNAWPSLHWNLFDYYLHPAGSYFGAKVGSRLMHVAYDYTTSSIYLINRSLAASGSLDLSVDLLSLDGKTISSSKSNVQASPNSSKRLAKVDGIDKIKDVALLKLALKSGNKVLSRNVYHLTPRPDTLDFDNSTWYHTPVTNYADFKALNKLSSADLEIKINGSRISLHNKSKTPAVFIRLNLVDGSGQDVVPIIWSDNYVTLWPNERLELDVNYEGKGPGFKLEVDGWNVEKRSLLAGGY